LILVYAFRNKRNLLYTVPISTTLFRVQSTPAAALCLTRHTVYTQQVVSELVPLH